MIKNRDGAWHREGDEVIDNAVIEAAMSANVKAVPSKLKATIQFGYDFGLASYLEETNQTFDSWIANVFTHTQAHFRHNESLGTTIEFEVLKWLIETFLNSRRVIKSHTFRKQNKLV